MLVKSNFRSHSDFQIQSWVGMWVVSCSNPNLNLKLIIRVGGLVGGRLVKSDFISHSGSHQSSAWIENRSRSRSTDHPAGWGTEKTLFATLGSNLDSESKLSSDESQSGL